MRRQVRLLAAAALFLSSCGGGGGGGATSGGASPGSGGGAVAPTSVYTVPAQEMLTQADVERVIAQAVAEARARGKPAVIAVSDRVGNVLAVFRMNGAPASATTSDKSGFNADHSAAGLTVPAELAAIAKAMTGAFLSSGGNAFSTRTASTIVQEHFPPSQASHNLAGGPLFGVQFSSLACSDLAQNAKATAGPKGSPLGLAADPGGFPLYKNGVLVGGVGVLADGVYGFDPDIGTADPDLTDEAIALAGTIGFDAPASIRSDQISLAGTTPPYSDATPSSLKSTPASAPDYSTLGGVGALVAVGSFYPGGSVLAGQPYGAEASGVRKATAAEFNNPDAFILTDGSGHNRYPASAGADGPSGVNSPLTASEVSALLEEAFKVMSHTRAQIRQPLSSLAQVSISVVDTRGTILGIVRSPDAPIFGIDTSLQKARTAAFFANARAASELNADPDSDPYLKSVVANVRSFLNDNSALTGKTAFGVRSIGDLARPFFPDGQENQPNGPLSVPYGQFTIFNTGLQFSLVKAALLGQAKGQYCTDVTDTSGGAPTNPIADGIQIFAGGVPIYRNGALVGAIGISGDGIDQDDLIGFLGLYNAGVRVGSIGEADPAIRADQIVVALNGESTRLRYVNCPVAPFVDTSQQNVCQGK
jgi:uncharacterized protein GlcG (DUF336 family)